MPNIPVSTDGLDVPIVFFDLVTNQGTVGGCANIVLAVNRNRVDGNGGIKTDVVVVAELRCSSGGFAALKTAIDAVILLNAPLATDDKSKN